MDIRFMHAFLNRKIAFKTFNTSTVRNDMRNREKALADIILLHFLILLGAIPFSLYARWIAVSTAANALELIKHVLIMWSTSLVYSFVSTTFLKRINISYLVSPIVLWIYAWLLNFLGEFYTIRDSFDVTTMPTTLFIHIFGLATVFYLSISQQILLRRVFGFDGSETDCYFRGLVSPMNIRRISRIFKEQQSLSRILRLRVSQKLKNGALEVKAFNKKREVYLFFFGQVLKSGKTALNIVAYKKNISTFECFISSPNWVKELADNSLSILTNRGFEYDNVNSPDFRQETFEFAFRGVNPLVSKRNIEILTLPLILVTFSVMMSVIAAFFIGLTPTLSIEIITLIVTLIIFMVVEYRRKN